MYKVSYMGDGSTTEFTFNFPFYENSNIIVSKNNTVITTGYTVVGTSAGENADIPCIGGKVVFTIAPIATDSITISRSLPLTRIVDYQPTELINPTVLNQDQNYIMEVLKDFDDKLDDMDEKYNEIIDTESTETLIQKIDTVSTQITNLGDISTLRQNVSDLITTTENHTTTIASHTNTIGSHTTNIENLDTRTNGIIDYVIESQNPTAENNYTWYRKYKSGWVEQGGSASVAAVNANETGTKTITFPVSMVCATSTNYKILITRTGDPGNTFAVTTRTGTRTSTTFELCYFTTVAVANSLTFDWEAKGIAA